MGRKDFDNLYKVIEGASILTSTTLVSLEIDLELPIGFIAKIWNVMIRIEKLSEDLEASSVDQEAQISMALIRDPDDVTTQTMNSNRVQHDVIADYEVSVGIVAGTAGDPGYNIYPTEVYNLDIPEHVDLVTARNLRFNCVAEGADAASITETQAIVQIRYTLEKVTDADILELLDIL